MKGLLCEVLNKKDKTVLVVSDPVIDCGVLKVSCVNDDGLFSVYNVMELRIAINTRLSVPQQWASNMMAEYVNGKEVYCPTPQ